jgi:phage terminase small subunit
MAQSGIGKGAYLTSRQLRFVREYLVDMNATQAAIRSGYSADNAGSIGYQLLENPLVAAQVEKLQDARAAALAIKAEDVLGNLLAIAARAMQAEEVTEWDFAEKCFKGTGEYRFDSTGANRANELIGKHLGMFTDKIDLKANVTVGIAESIRARRFARRDKKPEE